MELNFSIISMLLFTILVLAGLATFGYVMYRRFMLMTKGPGENRFDQIPKRIAAALKFNHDETARRIETTGFDDARHVYWANLKEVRLDALNYHNIDWSVKGAHEFMEANRAGPFLLAIRISTARVPFRYPVFFVVPEIAVELTTTA